MYQVAVRKKLNAHDSCYFSGAVKVSITVGKTTISVVEGDIAEQQVCH
jgi:hypothetical protein